MAVAKCAASDIDTTSTVMGDGVEGMETNFSSKDDATKAGLFHLNLEMKAM